MIILNINGPINSGKSTTGQLLVKMLPQSLFIEVDELLLDTEQEEKGLDFRSGIAERLKRLDRRVIEEIQRKRYKYLIFAYPMSENNFLRWKSFGEKGNRFVAITLAPCLERCLTNRGMRDLSEWERKRIREMYEKGYHHSVGADLIIDNGEQTPFETASVIRDFVLNLESK